MKLIAALLIVLATTGTCSSEPVRLGRIQAITYQDNPRYVAILTTTGGVYEMNAYRAWNCYDGGVLWQSPSGVLYCQ